MSLIQWFPGHMAKTTRLLQENLGKVDVLMEILDARVPLSSRNPLIESLQKPRIIILNKSDLAMPAITEKWMRYFRNQGHFPISISAISNKNLSVIGNICRDMFQDKKWYIRRPVRAMIVGIPNVGKSTIINSLRKRKVAATANKPGVTKDLHRFNVNSKLQIFDTPGLLWHKFEDQETGLKLAMVGTVKEAILPMEEIAVNAVRILTENYSTYIEKRYNIEIGNMNEHEILEKMAIKKGCLKKGGIPHFEKICRMFIMDIRNGNLGPISLECPDDFKRSENNE